MTVLRIDRLFDLFTRRPGAGGRKEPPMPHVPSATPPAPAGPQLPTQAPAQASTTAPAGAGPAPDPRDELAKTLSTLTDAMRQMAESHKTLLEAVKGTGVAAPAPAAAPGSGDVGGDPPGGTRPAAVVDYSRLSPVQQITLGLKDAAARPAARAGAD